MSSAVDAYRQVQKSTPTARKAEAMAFSKAAVLLEEAKEKASDYDAYSAALKFNQVLWTLLQSDVSSADNTLPDDLKKKIFNLSIFVDRQTLTALAEPKAENLSALIDINRNMAKAQFDER